MKAIALLSIFILAACGKVDVPNTADFETTKSLNPVKYESTSSEHKKIKDICEALEQKEATIPGLVGSNYSFTNTSKKCDDSGASNLPDSAVTLVNQGGLFKFQEGFNLYYFSDVETKSQGALSQICANLSNLSSPIRPDATNVIYFSATENQTGNCAPGSGEICIMVEKAVVDTTSEGERGRIHTREWITFKTIQPLLGFWTARKLSSVGGCLEGSHFDRTATLKFP